MEEISNLVQIEGIVCSDPCEVIFKNGFNIVKMSVRVSRTLYDTETGDIRKETKTIIPVSVRVKKLREKAKKLAFGNKVFIEGAISSYTSRDGEWVLDVTIDSPDHSLEVL